jgi:glycogen synthase
MHVLMTADTVGGVWTYTQDLVGELVRNGVQVTLVSFGGLPSSEQTEWLRDLPEVDYRPTSLRLEWMREAAGDVEIARQYLTEVVRQVRPDLLHCNQFSFGSIQAEIPRVVVAHSDVVSWWISVHGNQPPENEWAWYRREVQNGLQGADLVIAPSGWMMSALTANYQFDGETRVIYNGRNVALFKSCDTRDNFVLSVGRLWDKGKQLRLLLDENQSVPVYIAGASTEPGTATIAPNGDPRLIGMLAPTQLIDLYSRASIYVATSRYEPFGLAPVEAALSGCALILNDLPIFRELWDDDALYFECNDSHSLARVVTQLSQSDGARQGLANRAQRRARERFSATRMADEYCKVYEQVCLRERVA